MKKVVRGVILSVLTFCFFVTCKNYTADIDDYLSYWSTEASIAGYAFDTVTQTDIEGMQCVPSKAAVTVTFTLRNPKNFDFKMPGDSGAPADIVTFPRIRNESDKNAAIALQPCIDYEFKKISNTKLALTYNPAFLQKYEWGREDITPSIILYTTDGRHFKQDIQRTLKVNTLPPAITHYTVAKTKTNDPEKDAYYVLCLQVSDMDVRVPGGLLHKDIVGIEINGTMYSLSVNEEQHTFIKPEDTAFLNIMDVEKLESDAGNIPSGWVLYFKTDVPVKDGSAKKEYAVRLKDAKGLYSKSVTAMTQLNVPQQAFTTIITGTKKDSLSGDGTTHDQAIVIKAAALVPEARIKLSVSATDITIHYTLAEIGHVPTPAQTGTSPVTIDMPLNGAGERHYALTHYTTGIGFKPSDPKTVYYKVLKEYTVTFDSKGGSEVPAQKILHGSQILSIPAAPTAPAGYTFRNWCIDESCTTAWDFASGTVTSDITLYAKWDPLGGVSYTVQHFQQNIDDDNYPTAPSATQTLSGTAGTLTTATANAYAGFEPLPFEQKTIVGDGSTVVEVKYKRKRITVTFKLDGGKIGSTTDDVTKEGKFGATFTAPADPTRDGYTFNGWLPALSSSLTYPVANATYTAQWKQNTYTVTFKVDGGQGGTLTGTYNSTPKTTSGSTEQQFESVPHNSTITFTADPAAGYEVDSWTDATPEAGNNNNASLKVQDNVTVTVKFKQQAAPITTWEALRTAVQNASDGTVIEIAKNLTYNIAAAGSNKSTITVEKDITIRSKGSTPYILDANGRGADVAAIAPKVIGIFEVTSGKTLTLENVILTKTEKYAVYVDHNSSLTMKNVTINNCKTQDDAAGIYFNKGKDLTLENCTLEKCKGKGNDSRGGMYIQEPKGTVSIKGTKIEKCEGNGAGGGIHLYNANNVQCKLENVTVDNCSAKSGGGIYAKGGTLTITGGSFINNSAGGTITSGGGGAIYSEGAKVTITGCTIGDDDSNKGNYAGQGGGIFVNGGAECILEAGTKIIGNSAIDLGTGTGNGGGVYVAGNSSLKMENVTIKNCEATGTDSAGGGVYLYKGTCALEKVSVEGCKAPKGGGIFVSKEAECILKEDVKILQNEAMGTNSNGGGIFVDKVSKLGKLTIKGSNEKPVVIAKNEADNHGGGLYSFGTVNIEYAEIKENKVKHNGGGMYNEGTCTMDHVTIQNNKAFTEDIHTSAGCGGGIYNDKELTLKDTIVTDNTAKKSGGGIYITEHSSAFLNISGSTIITVDTSKNDVFLREGKFITISGFLTAIGNVARITLEKYTVGAKVLQVSSTDDCTKFTVTPNSAGTWSINSDGKLQKP